MSLDHPLLFVLLVMYICSKCHVAFSHIQHPPHVRRTYTSCFPGKPTLANIFVSYRHIFISSTFKTSFYFFVFRASGEHPVVRKHSSWSAGIERFQAKVVTYLLDLMCTTNCLLKPCAFSWTYTIMLEADSLFFNQCTFWFRMTGIQWNAGIRPTAFELPVPKLDSVAYEH